MTLIQKKIFVHVTQAAVIYSIPGQNEKIKSAIKYE